MNSKKRKSTKSETINSKSNTENGFYTVDTKLRSILMHPIGMPLTTLLNDIPPPTIQSDDFLSLVNQNDTFLTHDADLSNRGPDRDKVFAAAILKWNGTKEKELTSTIHSYITSLSARGRIHGYGDGTDNSLLFESQKNTTAGPVQKGSGFMDVVISETNNDTTTTTAKPSLVAIVEVGINHDLWWGKTDQILKYVQLIRSNTEADNSIFSFDQPILLTVITVSKKGSDVTDTANIGIATSTDGIATSTDAVADISEEPNWSAMTNDEIVADFEEHWTKVEALSDTGSTLGDASVTFQFGVFLCSPKGSKDYRIALLWRKKTTSLKQASAQFGKVLYASKVCAQLRKSLANVPDRMYEYLGPNCCRIDKFLYRCYDNRLRPTERSPTLYGVSLQPTTQRQETQNGICIDVLHVLDEVTDQSTILPFGQLPQRDDGIKRLWKCQGQVKVIVTEYRDGVHYAKQPEHFLPIIDHLEQLHHSGYVHGDIRAYNMVLSSSYVENEQPEGWLIDFDYGGKVTPENCEQNITRSNQKYNPKYPRGYVKNLPDGFRTGVAGENITFDDDWYALGYVMLKCHELRKSDKAYDKVAFAELHELQDNFFETEGNSFSSLEGGAANFLRAYIKLASKNEFLLKPSDPFKDSLKEHQFLEEAQTLRIGSKCATGSPPPKPADCN